MFFCGCGLKGGNVGLMCRRVPWVCVCELLSLEVVINILQWAKGSLKMISSYVRVWVCVCVCACVCLSKESTVATWLLCVENFNLIFLCCHFMLFALTSALQPSCMCARVCVFLILTHDNARVTGACPSAQQRLHLHTANAPVHTHAHAHPPSAWPHPECCQRKRARCSFVAHLARLFFPFYFPFF